MEEYRPLARRALWAVVALAIAGLVDLVAVWADVAEWRLLERVEQGEDVPLGDLDASDNRMAAIGATQFLLIVVCAFFFIRWLHAAYRNLQVLGAGALRYGPGWAIGAWFVPILNIWRPKQIVNDVWRASDPELPRDAGGQWQGDPVPAFFLVWWLLFLVSGWASNAAFRLAFSDEDAGGLQNSSLAYLVADASSALAALLAIFVVRRTTARQESRATRLAAEPSVSQPATSGV
jgi:Domain of unknown function (DUF4328)